MLTKQPNERRKFCVNLFYFLLAQHPPLSLLVWFDKKVWGGGERANGRIKASVKVFAKPSSYLRFLPVPSFSYFLCTAHFRFRWARNTQLMPIITILKIIISMIMILIVIIHYCLGLNFVVKTKPKLYIRNLIWQGMKLALTSVQSESILNVMSQTLSPALNSSASSFKCSREAFEAGGGVLMVALLGQTDRGRLGSWETRGWFFLSRFPPPSCLSWTCSSQA